MEQRTQHSAAAQAAAPSAKGVFQEVALPTAQPASENGAVNTEGAENAAALAARSHQVEPTAVAAPMPMWVVLGETVKPALALVGFRLCLLALRAKISVFSLQRRYAVLNDGNALAQDRRRAMLVDQRLKFFEQRLYHFVSRRGVQMPHGSQGGAL